MNLVPSANFASPRPDSNWGDGMSYGMDEASMSEDVQPFDPSAAIDIHQILGIVNNVENTMEMN